MLITEMDNKPNEVLEPRLNEELNKEKLVRGLLIEKPNITKMSSCGLLDKVKSFLPQMAEAEKKLRQAVSEEGGDVFDVENVAGDENVIEMDIAMMGDMSSDNGNGNGDNSDKNLIKAFDKSWTSDSEDDSSPSPSENSYTSDTDISSSSTCSSSSCDESPAKQKLLVLNELHC